MTPPRSDTGSERGERSREYRPTLASASFLDSLRLSGRSEATLKAHENALRQFGRFLDGAGLSDLRDVTPSHTEAYARQVQDRISRESAYVYLNSVRVLFRFLVERNVLLVDPSSSLPMPKMRERLTGRILTPDEMTRLIESQDAATPTGLRDRAMLEFLYSTGLRVSEHRRVKSQDLGEDSVTVRGGKGAKDRVVPVGVRAMAWVRRYIMEARTRFAEYRPGVEELWLTRWGKPFGEQMMQIHLRALGTTVGIAYLTCHMIRRSMATHLLTAGASPSEVSAILGHSDLKSLSRYVKVATREVKETHARTHPRETDEVRKPASGEHGLAGPGGSSRCPVPEQP
ncbi:MAG: tyrosine-type recombinase/integrase [Planctomycetes bacterium]|nr:tyrosine-type recombinase/integrase [Planctomycetota bacterium]